MAQCENCGAGLRPGLPRCVKCGSLVPERPDPAPREARHDTPHPGGGHGPSGVNVNVNIDRGMLQENGADEGDWDDDYDDDYDDWHDLQPHRGGAILAWALVGWFLCYLIGPIIAISMAKRDLREMDAGIKDPSGRGTVQAGKVIAIIALVLQLITLALGVISAVAENL